MIEQDPVDKNLLYLGTEFGLFISFDDGVNWMKWTHGVPTVPVRALIVHPRDHALVIGTHGRAAFVLDDVRPLRSVAKTLFKKPVHLFEVPATYQHEIKAVAGYHFPADAIYRGEGKTYGAMISYSVNPTELTGKESNKSLDNAPANSDSVDAEKKQKKKVSIQILNAKDKVIRTFDGPMKKGINRVFWDLRRDGFQMPSVTGRSRGFSPPGPEVLPGIYIVKIKIGKHEATQDVEVLPDPRVKTDREDQAENYNTLVKIGEQIEIISEAVKRIRKMDKTIDVILEKMKDDTSDGSKQLQKDGKKLKKRLKQVMGLFVDGGGKQGITRQDNVSRKLWYVSGSLGSSYDKPTSSQMTYLRQAEKALRDALDEFNQVFETDVVEFQKKVEKSEFKLFPRIQKLDLNWRKKADH